MVPKIQQKKDKLCMVAWHAMWAEANSVGSRQIVVRWHLGETAPRERVDLEEPLLG